MDTPVADKPTLAKPSAVPFSCILSCIFSGEYFIFWGLDKPRLNTHTSATTNMKKLILFAATVALAAGSVGQARASILIQVDVSNVNAVTFVATSANAAGNFGPVDSWYGVALVDFFSGNDVEINVESSAGNSLNAFDSNSGTTRGTTINGAWVGDEDSWTYNDVCFFDWDEDPTSRQIKKVQDLLMHRSTLR